MGKTEIGTILLVSGVVGGISGSLVGIIPEGLTRDEALTQLGESHYEVDHTFEIPVPNWKLEVLVCRKFILT